MSGLHINTSDPAEQRKFGLLMAAAISVLGLIRWVFHSWGAEAWTALPYPFFAVAAVFLVFGLVFPRALKPLFVVWMKFAEVVNVIVTHVLLTIVFFLMIVPARAIIGLLKKDLLNQKWPPSAADSYWEDPEVQPKEFERYLNQF